MERLSVHDRVRAALLVWAAWTGVALLFMLYVMLPSPAAGNPLEWLRATAWQLVGWWSWALCTPLVVAVTHRTTVMQSRIRLIAVHIAAGTVVSGICTVLQGALRWTAFPGVRVRYDFAGASSLPLADAWSFNLVVYAMAVGVYYMLRASRLEAQLARSRLDALSARLRPHFLFNTLNTISALVPDDPKAAQHTIAHLSELLRQAFDRGEDTEVTLSTELQLLEHYVAIQRQRFGARLRVFVEVEPGAEGAMVPALLLQPLIENAVTHGLAGGDANGTVCVQVRGSRKAQRLRLVVLDDGPGLRAPQAERVGLTGTRARLAELYGSGQRLEVSGASEGGARVLIEIPFTTDARADR
jgi:glucose-6-phosphate-specific signal transduction histidine kinase